MSCVKLFTLVVVVSTLSPAVLSAQNAAPETPKFRFLNYVSLNPDGKMLATYQRVQALRPEHDWEVQHILMDRIQIWNTATGKLVRQIPGRDKEKGKVDGTIVPESIDAHLDNVDSAVFSGDGKWLIRCYRDGYVKFLDTATWQAVRGFSVTPKPGKGERLGARACEPFWNMAVSADVQWLAVSNKCKVGDAQGHPVSDDSKVWYWDAKSEKCVFTADVAKDCALALSRDGNVLAAGDDVWDLTKLKELYQLGVARGIWNDAWTLTAKGQECSPPFLNTRVIGTALDGDGKRLVALETYRWGGASTGYWAYSLKSFDTGTRKELVCSKVTELNLDPSNVWL